MTTLIKLRLVLACCVALSLSTIAALGQATSPTTTTGQTTTSQTAGANQEDRRDHSNWGWLGLLGLLGLGGLMKKRDADNYDRLSSNQTRRVAKV